MSDWNYSDSIADNARLAAMGRSAAYWAGMDWFMWAQYPTQLSNTWQDPWIEQRVGGSHAWESGGITNDYPTYDMTQNAYYIFVWLACHGYSKYAITAILTSWTNESTLTGGAWEGNYHPFESIVQRTGVSWFNPEINPQMSAWGLYQQLQPASNFEWRNGSNNSLVYWQASATDTRIHQTFTLGTEPGSYASIENMGRPLATYTETDPGTGVTYTRVRTPPRFDTSAYGSHGGGYGLAQWTNYTRLPALARSIAPDAPRHWQLNPTLQLEIVELQRQLSRGDQNVEYMGSWVNNLANNAVVYAGINPRQYGQPMSWDYWAGDNFLAWVDAQAAALTPPITDPQEIEWMRRQFAIDVWVRCYEGFGGSYDYAQLQMRTISLYWFQCVERWTASGYNITDVPRSRDVSYCSLDRYHITPETIPIYIPNIRKRRGEKHVRTVLFRDD